MQHAQIKGSARKAEFLLMLSFADTSSTTGKLKSHKTMEQPQHSSMYQPTMSHCCIAAGMPEVQRLGDQEAVQHSGAHLLLVGQHRIDHFDLALQHIRQVNLEKLRRHSYALTRKQSGKVADRHISRDWVGGPSLCAMPQNTLSSLKFCTQNNGKRIRIQQLMMLSTHAKTLPPQRL